MKDLSIWNEVHDPARLDPLVIRAMNRRGLTLRMTPEIVVTEAMYKTDGYVTLAHVTVAALHSHGTVGPVTGYGVAVKSGRDKFNEEIGANIAITRAFECAATVLKQKLPRRNATHDKH